MQKYDVNKPYYREHPLLDTAKACIDRQESTCLYIGGGKPHFPVPAMTNRAIAKSIFAKDKIGNLKAYRERLK